MELKASKQSREHDDFDYEEEITLDFLDEVCILYPCYVLYGVVWCGMVWYGVVVL